MGATAFENRLGNQLSCDLFSFYRKVYQYAYIGCFYSLTGLGVVSVRYADHFRYCLQVDSSSLNQEQLDFLINQIEQQVEELFLETAKLKRKISTETSLFSHERDGKKQLVSSQEVVCRKRVESNADLKSGLTACNNNNNNKNNKGTKTGFYIGGVLVSSNYSFIFKLKDSIDQIKDGIRRLKKQ